MDEPLFQDGPKRRHSYCFCSGFPEDEAWFNVWNKKLIFKVPCPFRCLNILFQHFLIGMREIDYGKFSFCASYPCDSGVFCWCWFLQRVAYWFPASCLLDPGLCRACEGGNCASIFRIGISRDSLSLKCYIHYIVVAGRCRGFGKLYMSCTRHVGILDIGGKHPSGHPRVVPWPCVPSIKHKNSR